MTPSGIETATFQFVAQHLNHCASAAPLEGNRINILGFQEWQNNLASIRK